MCCIRLQKNTILKSVWKSDLANSSYTDYLLASISNKPCYEIVPLCLIYQPVSILMTGGGGKKFWKVIKSLPSITDAEVQGNRGWLAKRDLNWSPLHKKEKSNLPSYQATKGKALKFLYSSLYLAFAPKQHFGRLISYRQTKDTLQSTHMEWKKLFSHDDHITVGVWAELRGQSFGNGQVIWKGQSPSSSHFPHNAERFAVV